MHLVPFEDLQSLTFPQLLLMKQDYDHMKQQAANNAQCDALSYSIIDKDSTFLSDRLEYWENEEYLSDAPEDADQADDQIAALSLLIKHFDYAVAIDGILKQLK